jgi:hypothetical protein
VLIQFTVAELNTLILFLAYALGHVQGLSDDDAENLFESAEILRGRIQSCSVMRFPQRS